MRIKFFLLIASLFFLILALFSSENAYAKLYCGGIDGSAGDFSDYSYSYTRYRCDVGVKNPYTGLYSPGRGCVLESHNVPYPDCNQFGIGAPYDCGFCKKLSDISCSERLIVDSEGRYYDCTIKHADPQTNTNKNGEYCQAYEKQTYCGGLTPKSCVLKSVDCTGKCGKWAKSNNCTYLTKDCGQNCGTGKTCVVDATSKAASKTNTGGYCRTASCQPKTCAQLGYDGKKGSICEKTDNGCGTGTITCGGCNSGLSCTGKNASGVGGKCNFNSDGNVTVLVFYDKFTKNSQKGIESAYSVCYPSTDGTNKPAGSANVTFTAQSGDTGGISKQYTYSSYKNCQRGGNSSSKGYTFITSGTSTKITLSVPTGYKATGYNYTVDGKATVRCIGTASSKCTNTLNSTPYLDGYNVTVRLGVVPGTTDVKLKGFVFLDDNANGLYEPGEQGNSEACFDSSKYGNLSVKYANNAVDSYSQDTSCNKYFSYTNTASAQTIRLNAVPTGYRLTGYEYQDATHPGTNSNCGSDVDTGAGWCQHESTSTDTFASVNLAGESEVHFGITTAPQTFSVSGTIFTDAGKQGFKDGSDDDYKLAQPKDISIYPADDAGNVIGSNINTVTNGNGGYTLSGLDAGTYSVQYTSTNGSGPPAGYAMTYPSVINPPPSILVSLGNGNPGCWIAKSGQTTLNDATCSGGNITGLNFGVTDASQPWFQSAGGDMRVDDDLTDPIPAGTGIYASTGVTSPAADPGILFTGKPSATLTSGASQSSKASTKGWLSTGNPYKAISGGTRLSYSYLNSVLTRGNVVNSSTTGLGTAGYCGSGSASNCTLTNVPKGVYKISNPSNNSLTIVGTTNPPVTAGSSVIILVPGDLAINSNIIIPSGSFLIFAVGGNITVGSSVTKLDGIYTTEGKFDTGSSSTALAINGALIANSAGTGSYSTISNVFINNRNLAANSTTPSVTFNLRPDFLTKIPDTLRVPNYVIQEVAPGPDFSFGTSQGTPTQTPTPTITPTPTPLPTPTPTPLPQAFLESGGSVAFEAENADARVTYAGNSWTNETDSNAVSNTLIRALPNNGTTSTAPNAAEVQYRVKFITTGTYYVWIRGNPPNSSSNNVSVGKNGTPNSTYVTFGNYGSWSWSDVDSSNNISTINIPTAGTYTFSLWERKDGMKIDRVVLKTTNTAPSGTGPAQSNRGN